MSKRRVLSILALGIAATAPTRVRASTEVEGVGYGGTSTGGWICGPVGRANYAGAGARVRVAERPGRFGGTGFTGEGAAAFESESSVTQCEPNQAQCVRNRSAGLLGAHARVGHQWDMFGFEAGATAFQGYDSQSHSKPSVLLIPDAEIAVGPRSVARGVLGIGSPSISTLRRPGGYVGADVALGTVDLQARIGVFRAGPALFDDTNLRADVALYVPIVEPLSLRVAGAVGENSDGTSGEGGAGLRAVF
jgi:hypothetical protein